MENTITYGIIAAFVLVCTITFLYRNRKTRRFIKQLLKFAQGCESFTHEDLGMKIQIIERNKRSVRVTNVTFNEITFNNYPTPIKPELYYIPKDNKKDELQKGEWYEVVSTEKNKAVKLVPTKV